MNTEETNYMGAAQRHPNMPPIPKAQKGTNTGWKRVVVGGVSGILLGTAGAFAASKVIDEVNQDDIDINPLTGEHHMATKVTDDMTFQEAFDAARIEVGHGGMFTWHGHVYGTFTAEEWNALPLDAQQEFYEAINAQTQPEIEEPAHVHHHHHDHVDVVHHVVADNPAPAPAQDDVKILGTEFFVDEDGNVHSMTGVEIDGHNGIVLGGEDPSNPDVAVIDINDSGTLDHPDVVVNMHTGESAQYGDIVGGTMASAEAAALDDSAVFVGNDMQTDDVMIATDSMGDVNDDVMDDVSAPSTDVDVFEASNDVPMDDMAINDVPMDDAPIDDMAYDVPVYDA